MVYSGLGAIESHVRSLAPSSRKQRSWSFTVNCGARKPLCWCIFSAHSCGHTTDAIFAMEQKYTVSFSSCLKQFLLACYTQVYNNRSTVHVVSVVWWGRKS